MLVYALNALRNLGRKKLRSFLTVTGIAIGVASVIVISSIGQGGKLMISNELDGLGINGLTIHSQSDDLSQTTNTLKPDDLKACEKVTGVQSAMPLIMQIGYSYLRDTKRSTLFWGIGSNAEQIISLKILHGRMISDNDVQTHAKICLVDDAFAKAVYKRSNITGKTVSVYLGDGYYDLKIAGVVESSSNLLYNLVGNYMPSFIYVPYTAAEEMRGKSGYDQISIKMDTNQNLDSAGKRIVSTLSRLHGGNDNYQAENMLKQKQRMAGLLGIVTLIISAVGAISLIVAGLGTMTVMMVSVNERTKEIGIKKSIGAKKRVILMEFLFEALLISLFGSLLGIASGFLLSVLVSFILHFSLQFSLSSALTACCFAAFIGVVFGIYPAVKASRLRPVDALRME